MEKVQRGVSKTAPRSMEIIEESVTVRAVGEIKVREEKIVSEIF
jgi:hypothetical protein